MGRSRYVKHIRIQPCGTLGARGFLRKELQSGDKRSTRWGEEKERERGRGGREGGRGGRERRGREGEKTSGCP